MAANQGYNPNLYNAGAVVFNTQPYTAAYEQALQRKQAQDDTLFRYFGDMGKNLTPAGMHSNDVPDFMDKKNQWQQYVLANKDAYLNPSKDKGKAYTQAMSMYNDALATAQASKDKVKGLSEVHSIFNDPNKRGLLTEQTLHDIEAGELPVNNPNYKPIDLTHINYNPKPWDIKDQSALVNEVSKYKGTEGAPNITKNIANKQLIFNYPNKFENKDLIGMHNLGSSLYGSNPGFKNIVDGLAKAGADPTDPNHGQFVQLNDLFKKHYGQDIQSPEDVAGAYVLSLNPAKSGRVVAKNDEAAMNIQKSNLGLGRQEQSFDYKEAAKTAKVKEAEDNVENWMQGQEEAAKKGGKWTYSSGANGTSVDTYKMKLTSDLEKVFEMKVGSHVVHPDDLAINENGDYLPIFYQKDKDGKTVTKNGKALVSETIPTKPVDREAVKASLAKFLPTRAVKQLQSAPKKEETLSTSPSDWKQEGNHWRYKDGSLYDANGNKIK